MARKRSTPLITDFDNIPPEALVPEDAQPYEIPSHWKWVRLGAVCHVNPPKPDVKAIADDCDVIFVPMPAVSEVTGSIVTPEKRALGTVKRGYTAFRSGDVLFAKITPCMENGKTAVVESDTDGIAYGSTEFFVLRPGECLNAYLLHAYLRQESFRLEARAVMTGAVGQQRVPRDFLEDLPFALPPIDEQKAIVNKLQETNQKIDDVLERLDQFLDQAPQQRAAIIQAGVTGNLTKEWREQHGCSREDWVESSWGDDCRWSSGGTPAWNDRAVLQGDIPEEVLIPEDEQPYEIPTHWEWVRLGAVLRDMETRKPSGTTFTYLDIASVDNELQKIRAPKQVETSKAPSRANRAVHTGATLFSMVRPYLHNIAFIDDDLAEAIASTGFYVCTPFDLVDSMFLFEYLRSSVFVEMMTAKMRGDNSPSIRADDLRQAAFPLPPVDEQKAIVDKLETALHGIETARKIALDVQEEVQMTKRAVVNRALRGIV